VSKQLTAPVDEGGEGISYQQAPPSVACAGRDDLL